MKLKNAKPWLPQVKGRVAARRRRIGDLEKYVVMMSYLSKLMSR
ncbi:MAG: hypothetical protein ACKFI0_00600 [Candidatus Hodgkinia cicadicola]